MCALNLCVQSSIRLEVCLVSMCPVIHWARCVLGVFVCSHLVCVQFSIGPDVCLVSMCAVIHQARCVPGDYVCSHPSG